MEQSKDKKAGPKKSVGDRIVQIVLLLLITASIASLPIIMGGAPSGAAGSAGRPGGMAGGPPGGAKSGAMGPEVQEEKAAAVETATVGLSDVREYIRVNGDVKSKSSVNIYPDVSGKITSFNVSLGDTVRRGQTIGYVDPSMPGQVYSDSAVISTISGTVISLNHGIGETVNSQTPVAVVGNLTDMEIVTFVPERYVGSLAAGLTAEMGLDAYPGEVFDAVVTEISPVLDTGSRTVEVKLAPLRQDPRLKVGMFASISIVINQSEGIVAVPPAALTSHYDQEVVYVVESGRAVMRGVVTGLRSSGSVEILEGLDVGEEVVIRGLSGITDGAALRAVNQE